ncbi:MAG: hypothetical protein GWP91_20705 [Rhodobacterales bacterium]|nr:hypothetical protein [Rhodobacterales bacterium]
MLVLSLLALNAFASDPCSKAKYSTDKATQETRIKFSGADWQIISTPTGTEYSTRLFRSGVTQSTLKEGWPMNMAFDDGSLMRIHLSQDAEAKTQTDETGSFTQWQTVFVVPDVSIERLAAAPITAIKTNLGLGDTTTEVGKARSKKLQAAFQCIAGQK